LRWYTGEKSANDIVKITRTLFLNVHEYEGIKAKGPLNTLLSLITWYLKKSSEKFHWKT
jgi:hypothetical protein